MIPGEYFFDGPDIELNVPAPDAKAPDVDVTPPSGNRP